MFAPWKESYGKPKPCIKKQRHPFLYKVCILEAMVFPVVMYICEKCTIKKPECWRIDAFKLWCWRRLFRDPWTARSNQSILKEINPEYLLEGLMLKLQYVGYLIWRADSLEKILMLGKIECKRRGWQRMRWLDGITYSMDTSLRKLGDGEVRGSLVCCNPRGCRVGHGWTTEQQGSVVKNLLHCSRFWFDLWVGKISWRKCNPLKYSCLEDSMDRGAWWATVHGVEFDMTEHEHKNGRTAMYIKKF